MKVLYIKVKCKALTIRVLFDIHLCEDLFINKLFSGKCIPTFLWSNRCLLTRIQELFQDSDNSIVSVAKKLKTDLRRYFSVPGKALCQCKMCSYKITCLDLIFIPTVMQVHLYLYSIAKGLRFLMSLV